MTLEIYFDVVIWQKYNWRSGLPAWAPFFLHGGFDLLISNKISFSIQPSRLSSVQDGGQSRHVTLFNQSPSLFTGLTATSYRAKYYFTNGHLLTLFWPKFDFPFLWQVFSHIWFYFFSTDLYKGKIFSGCRREPTHKDLITNAYNNRDRIKTISIVVYILYKTSIKKIYLWK